MTAEMTTAFTSHVVPKNSAMRLMTCTSSSRNARPRKKKCHSSRLGSGA